MLPHPRPPRAQSALPEAAKRLGDGLLLAGSADCVTTAKPPEPSDPSSRLLEPHDNPAARVGGVGGPATGALTLAGVVFLAGVGKRAGQSVRRGVASGVARGRHGFGMLQRRQPIDEGPARVTAFLGTIGLATVVSA